MAVLLDRLGALRERRVVFLRHKVSHIEACIARAVPRGWALSAYNVAWDGVGIRTCLADYCSGILRSEGVYRDNT